MSNNCKNDCKHKELLIESCEDCGFSANTIITRIQKELDEASQRIASQALVLEGYKVLAGLSDPDPIKIFGMVENEIKSLRAQLEEAKRRIVVLDRANDLGKENWSKKYNELKEDYMRLRSGSAFDRVSAKLEAVEKEKSRVGVCPCCPTCRKIMDNLEAENSALREEVEKHKKSADHFATAYATYEKENEKLRNRPAPTRNRVSE